MRTCVIIPAYNESTAIAGLINQIIKSGLAAIVIDDGSVDDTAKIASDCGAQVLIQPKNMGKGAALIKGYKLALEQGFDAVISMDGDGQHSGDDLLAFIRQAQVSSSALIIGNRMGSTRRMPFLRLITNVLMSELISFVVGQKIPDTQCGYRLIKKELLSSLTLSTSKYETESEVLIKAGRLGFKIESIPVKTIYSGQKSQINPFSDTLRFLRFMFSEFTRSPKHG